MDQITRGNAAKTRARIMKSKSNLRVLRAFNMAMGSYLQILIILSMYIWQYHYSEIGFIKSFFLNIFELNAL
jgi:hypothetical protein